MITLGIDLGTTKVAAVLIDTEEGRVMWTGSEEHAAALAPRTPFESIQDPKTILETARSLFHSARSQHEGSAAIEGVCLSGQMHGVLYLDSAGRPLSPLYTWLDARGAELRGEGESYAAFLTRRTGYRVAPGFGAATHLYNHERGLVPQGAASVGTIMDYLAMELCGRAAPLSDPTTAASIGLFDLEKLRFDPRALTAAGFDRVAPPEVVDSGTELGTIEGGVPLFAPVADNQASFLGSVRSPDDSVLINIGTAGQLSLYSRSAHSAASGIEVRPFPGRGYLHVGAALCSGKAYEQLRTFFRGVLGAFGADERAVDYAAMNRLAEAAGEARVSAETTSRGAAAGPPLVVDTRFAGTRSDPARTGGISNITLENLTPGNLARAYIEGIAEELAGFYASMAGARPPSHVVGSGNALRSSPLLRTSLERRFARTLELPRFREEAALGAALCAAVAAGAYPDYRSAGALIRYES